MKNFRIVGNYLNDTYDCYIKDWDRTFDPANNLGGMSIISQVQYYLLDEQNMDYGTTMVKTGKAIAKCVKSAKVRIGDASAIAVDNAAVDVVKKHFAPEINKSIWILEVTGPNKVEETA